MGKIVVPTIYVPSWTEVVTQASVGVRGELEWKLIEKHGGKEVVVRQGKQKNMIMDSGLKYWAQSMIEMKGLIAYFYIGTGTAAPEKSQTTLENQLGKYISSMSSEESSSAPHYCARTFRANEGTGNGDLTEWGVGWGDGLLCRELFRDETGEPVVITKTNNQVMDFTYTLYIERAADFSTSLLTANDIEYICVATMNDAQLKIITSYQWSTLNPLRLKLGTSNAESDLVNDSHSTIKGNLLAEENSNATLEPYVAGSFSRSQTGVVQPEVGNGSIGEALFGWNGPTRYACRVTYNPPIEKTESMKLYLGVEWTFGAI